MYKINRGNVRYENSSKRTLGEFFFILLFFYNKKKMSNQNITGLFYVKINLNSFLSTNTTNTLLFFKLRKIFYCFFFSFLKNFRVKNNKTRRRLLNLRQVKTEREEQLKFQYFAR